MSRRTKSGLAWPSCKRNLEGLAPLKALLGPWPSAGESN